MLTNQGNPASNWCSHCFSKPRRGVPLDRGRRVLDAQDGDRDLVDRRRDVIAQRQHHAVVAPREPVFGRRPVVHLDEPAPFVQPARSFVTGREPETDACAPPFARAVDHPCDERVADPTPAALGGDPHADELGRHRLELPRADDPGRLSVAPRDRHARRARCRQVSSVNSSSRAWVDPNDDGSSASARSRRSRYTAHSSGAHARTSTDPLIRPPPPPAGRTSRRR